MDKLVPESYVVFVATIALAAGLLCMIVSFRTSLRNHSTRLFAISIVSGLALFANHWATYFAAIFIVATAVTELEFLQNLAAIIRKDPNYFNYQKEKLTRGETMLRTQKEELVDEIAEEDAVTGDSETKAGKDSSVLTPIAEIDVREISHRQRLSIALGVEDNALKYISKKYPESFEKHVRYKKASKSVELDGIIYGKDGSADKIVEIKWLRNRISVVNFTRFAVDRLRRDIGYYKEITGKNADGLLVLVFSNKEFLSDKLRSRLEEFAAEFGVNIEYLSLHDIGFTEVKF